MSPFILPLRKVIRILCPASICRDFIGERGSNICEIREKTGTFVRLEESYLGCDERVIIVGDDSLSAKEAETSSVQEALLHVFGKIVEILSEIKEGDEESNKPSSSVAWLLVSSGQVGCLLGKEGSVIKQMSYENGEEIEILPKENLPRCAFFSDKLVQISGDLDAIGKALQSVSQLLLEYNPRNQDYAAQCLDSYTLFSEG